MWCTRQVVRGCWDRRCYRLWQWWSGSDRTPQGWWSSKSEILKNSFGHLRSQLCSSQLPAQTTSTQPPQGSDPGSSGCGWHLGSRDLEIQPEWIFCGHPCDLDLFYINIPILLTCNLADGEVVSRPTLRVPDCPLDTVRGSCLKTVKGQLGVAGVDLVAQAGALSDDAERIKDSVLHWSPVHKNGAVVGGGGGQHGRLHHCRKTDKQFSLDNGQHLSIKCDKWKHLPAIILLYILSSLR